MSKISPKCAKELTQIINLLPQEYLKKIPYEEITYLESIKDNDYNTNIKSIEDINSKNIMDETKPYLAYIFLKYLASDEEKKEYKVILNANEKRYQKDLSEKYDVSNIFKKRNERKNYHPQEEKSLIKIEDKNIFQIILEKIKRLFTNKK